MFSVDIPGIFAVAPFTPELHETGIIVTIGGDKDHSHIGLVVPETVARNTAVVFGGTVLTALPLTVTVRASTVGPVTTLIVTDLESVFPPPSVTLSVRV